MRPLIEFCSNNMHHGTGKIMQKLEADPDLDVIEYGCLGNCGECYMFPYALVNGEFVAAETPDELYDKIMEKIRELEELDRLFDDEETPL
jgi:uncharacterized protein YuzB (UPF0349 family)